MRSWPIFGILTFSSPCLSMAIFWPCQLLDNVKHAIVSRCPCLPSDLYIKASPIRTVRPKGCQLCQRKEMPRLPPPLPKVFDVRPSVKLAPDKNNIRERGEGVAYTLLWQKDIFYGRSDFIMKSPLWPCPTFIMKGPLCQRTGTACQKSGSVSVVLAIWPLMALYGLSL